MRCTCSSTHHNIIKVLKDRYESFALCHRCVIAQLYQHFRPVLVRVMLSFALQRVCFFQTFTHKHCTSMTDTSVLHHVTVPQHSTFECRVHVAVVVLHSFWGPSPNFTNPVFPKYIIFGRAVVIRNDEDLHPLIITIVLVPVFGCVREQRIRLPSWCAETHLHATETKTLDNTKPSTTSHPEQHQNPQQL